MGFNEWHKHEIKLFHKLVFRATIFFMCSSELCCNWEIISCSLTPFRLPFFSSDTICILEKIVNTLFYKHHEKPLLFTVKANERNPTKQGNTQSWEQAFFQLQIITKQKDPPENNSGTHFWYLHILYILALAQDSYFSWSLQGS